MLGKQLGPYRITSKLAEGGMGEVYLARHDLMDRDAVVKVLHAKFSHDQEVVQRFLNEARAAASIHHPGIVEIYDLGKTSPEQEGAKGQGQVYIVMERLRGENLAERIARKPLAPERTVALSKQLASALGAAHLRRIVHRDLKPENIFVVPDPDIPGGERVKILDFGVAKLADNRDVESRNLTAQGSVFGTPAYMAPEQCEDSAKVDHRADLYAVGCIMYEMLCGQPPFGRGGFELIAAHLRDEPPPLRERAPTVPVALADIIHRLLAKAPGARYASCDELIAVLDGETPAAVTAPTAPRPAPEDLAFAATVPPQGFDGGVDLDRDRDRDAPTGGLAAGGAGDRDTGSDDTGSSTGEPFDTSAPFSTGVGGAAASPTTHRRAVGELANPLPTERPRGRRTGLMAALAVIVFAAVAVGYYTMLRQDTGQAQRPDRDPEPPPPPPVVDPSAELLEQALADLDDLHWEKAYLTASRILDTVAEDSPTHARALEIQERAQEGQKYAWAYQLFTESLDEGEHRAAVYAYDQLPPDSIYRQRAQPAYERMRDEWLAPRRKRAAKFASKRRCRKLDAIAEDVGFLFPDAVADITAMRDECRANRKKKSASDANVRVADKSGTMGHETAGKADSGYSSAAGAGNNQPPAGDAKGDAKGDDRGENKGERKSDPATTSTSTSTTEGAPSAELPEQVALADVKARLSESRHRYRRCWLQNRVRGPMTLEFQISPQGMARNLSIDVDSVQFRTCMWLELRRERFPRARRWTKVKLPLGRKRGVAIPHRQWPARPFRR